MQPGQSAITHTLRATKDKRIDVVGVGAVGGGKSCVSDAWVQKDFPPPSVRVSGGAPWQVGRVGCVPWQVGRVGGK